MSLKLHSTKEIENGLSKVQIILDYYTLVINCKEHDTALSALEEITGILNDDEFQIQVTNGSDILIDVLKTEDDKEPKYTITQFKNDTSKIIQNLHDLLNLKF